MKILTPLLIIISIITLSCQKDTIDPASANPASEFTLEASGCSEFIVYKMNEELTKSLAIGGIRDTLGLSTTEQTYMLGTSDAPSPAVEIYEFDRRASNYFCNDVPDENTNIVNIWTATSGTARFRIVRDSISVSEWQRTYTLNIILENVTFEADGEEDITLESMTIDEVLVGWLPG